jgi:PAS domain S-box-containing protein
VDDQITAEHLKRVVECLTDGIILLDREGTCLYFNPEAARILGQKLAGLAGQPFNVMITDTVSLLPVEARSRIVKGEGLLLSRSFFAKSQWYEVLGRPVGEAVLIHFRDITERLVAESARRQSEERFRLFVRGVRDHALIMLDPKGQIATWNTGAERISGFTANEVMGKHLSMFFPADAVERGEVARRLEGAVKNGSYMAEGWIVRKDGATVRAQTTYNCLYDDLGEPTGFALVTRDITAQRRMQEQLRTEQERLRLAVEAAGVGTFDENLETGELVQDRQCMNLLGWSPDHQLRSEEFFSVVHPEDRQHLELVHRHLLDVPGTSEFEVDYRVVRPRDGEVRWMESQGKVIESVTQPGRRRLLGVLRDTTKGHEIEELRKLAAGILAHDLRAPLSAIKLSGETLMRGEALPEGAVRKVHGIVRAVDRMAHMVEQLLLYTQAQFGGGLALERDLIDLAEVCRQALDDMRAANPHSEVHLEANDDCHGFWDPTRLTEVVWNLVGNAIKHGEPGKPVSVVARDEGERVTLRVNNIGQPIPPELLVSIFEPFRRGATERPARTRGFGLGLYITREIVRAHGGTIEVSSSGSAGTTFTVSLPRSLAAHPGVTVSRTSLPTLPAGSRTP